MNLVNEFPFGEEPCKMVPICSSAGYANRAVCALFPWHQHAGAPDLELRGGANSCPCWALRLHCKGQEGTTTIVKLLSANCHVKKYIIMVLQTRPYRPPQFSL